MAESFSDRLELLRIKAKVFPSTLDLEIEEERAYSPSPSVNECYCQSEGSFHFAKYKHQL